MPRFHCPLHLQTGADMALPEGAARHVQVLRMQPGMAVTLFNGQGGEYEATITHMGKRDVRVLIGSHQAIEREPQRHVHLAVGMPANDRMDWLVEKATELGVTRITPLITQRTVLRLSGERADKKRTHWQDIAAAACEQCGRNRVPIIDAPVTFSDWLASSDANHASNTDKARWVLSLHPHSQSLSTQTTWPTQATVLNGPEGGLTDDEDQAARDAGFAPITLGNRILRAETAALAALTYLTLPD
jgi:16S rRNA (uracil1498-N3)-methyltransferase